jgi:hypothetical protein
MSWVTVIWSMIASACLTLAAVHLLVWWRRHEAWTHALFDSKHVTFLSDPMTPDELREGFGMFVKELFSLRKTLRRAPRKFLGTALLSSLLKNAW